MTGKADFLKVVNGSDGEEEEEEGDDVYVAEELEDDEDDVNEDADYIEKLANGVSRSNLPIFHFSVLKILYVIDRYYAVSCVSLFTVYCVHIIIYLVLQAPTGHLGACYRFSS